MGAGRLLGEQRDGGGAERVDGRRQVGELGVVVDQRSVEQGVPAEPRVGVGVLYGLVLDEVVEDRRPLDGPERVRGG